MADRYDQLADELVGGAQEEFVTELTERMAAQLEADVSNADVYRVSVAAARAEAVGVWAKYKGKVSARAAAAFSEALSDVDEEAVTALQAGHADALKGLGTEGVKNAVAVASDQMARLISMQNTALANTAADAYYATVADAVTRLQMGEGRNAVMERAYAKLADAGIETVDYRSGRKTLIDAAVRRHVVTQQSQCRASLLDARMDEWGHDLVYVSAHYGARPSHSAWQGKVYSRSGKDKRYASLSAATGYGTAGGLCGCNCRHTYSPYVEGVSQLPSTDWSAQERLTGMTSDAYYAATQKQRAYERQIRKVKREIATGQAHGQDMASERAYLGALQAKQRAHVKANHLTRDYAREKAYGVKQQPTPVTEAELVKASPTVKGAVKAAAKKKVAAVAANGAVPSSAAAVEHHAMLDSELAGLTASELSAKKVNGIYVTSGTAVKSATVKLAEVGTDGPKTYSQVKVAAAIDGLASGKHDDAVVVRLGSKLYFHQGAVYADAARALGLDKLGVKLVDLDAVLASKPKAKAAPAPTPTTAATKPKATAKPKAKAATKKQAAQYAGPLTGMGKTFIDNRAADAYYAKNSFSKTKWAKLTGEQRKAVEQYTGHYYREMNRALRNGDYQAGTADAKTRGRIDRCTEALDAFTLKEDVIVYRGMGSVHAMACFLGIDEAELKARAAQGKLDALAGTRGYEDAFMSTGVTPGKAWSGPTLVALLPKGTPGFYVNPISTNAGELEVLVQRGSRYNVLKVEADATGHITAYAELTGFER
jgi:hypothetical protein